MSGKSTFPALQTIPVGQHGRILFAVGICSLGGLTFGYDLGALSASTRVVLTNFHLSPFFFGLTVSASMWGTVGGSLFAGHFAGRHGSRQLIALSALLYAISAGNIAFVGFRSWAAMLCLRFICGLAIGAFMVGCPLYMSWIAPPSLRGKIVGSFQLMIAAGVALAYVSGFVLAHFFRTGAYLRDCFGVGVLPPLLLLALLHWMPRDESVEIPHVQPGPPSPEKCLRSPGLFSKQYRPQLILASSIAVFNQLTGVSVLLIYVLNVFAGAGLSLLRSHTYTVVLACFSLGATLLSMGLVDQLGRRVLLVIGNLLMAACLFGLSMALHLHRTGIAILILLIAYNASFTFSQGTIIWIYLSEIFPKAVRAQGQAYGATVLSIVTALVVWLFPLGEHRLPALIFTFFGCMMLVQIVCIFLWYPETKNTALA